MEGLKRVCVFLWTKIDLKQRRRRLQMIHCVCLFSSSSIFKDYPIFLTNQNFKTTTTNDNNCKYLIGVIIILIRT